MHEPRKEPSLQVLAPSRGSENNVTDEEEEEAKRRAVKEQKKWRYGAVKVVLPVSKPQRLS